MEEEIHNLIQAKIESLLLGFKDLGINPNSNLNQSEIVRFLNTRSLGGQVEPLLVEKLYQVIDFNPAESISVQDFIDGFLQFEEEVKINFETFEQKLAEEREIFKRLDEQCRRYKNEQLNSEGFCQNAKIYGEITDVDIKRKLEGIKEIILIVVYNEKIQEMKFEIGGENSNTVLHQKFEFKPTSRKDHFEFIMKGVNDKDQVFEIGSKVFSLENVTSQDEYTIQIIIPEIDDEQSVAAYINAIITVYWSDYLFYDLQRRKAAKRLKKLTEATTKAKEFWLKVKEIFGNLSEKREYILVDYNNEKIIERYGKRIVGIKNRRTEVEKKEIKKKEEIQTIPVQVPVTEVEKKTEVKSVSDVKPKYIEIRKKAIEIPAIEPKIEETQRKEIVLPERENKVILTEKVLPVLVRNSQGRFSEEIRESVVKTVSPVKVIETIRPTIVVNKVGEVTEINNSSYQNTLINSEVTLPMQTRVSISPEKKISTTTMEKIITTTSQTPTTIINRSLRPIQAGVTVAPTKYINNSANAYIETLSQNINTQVSNINVNETSYLNEVSYPSQTGEFIYNGNNYVNQNIKNLYPTPVIQSINYNNGYDINAIFNESIDNTVINRNIRSIPLSGGTTVRKEILKHSVSPPIVHNTIRKGQRPMVLPAVNEYNQGRIIDNRSISGEKYRLNKREEVVTENLFPFSTSMNVTEPNFSNESGDKYIDELLKSGINNNYSSYANMHVIQNGANDYNLNLGVNGVNSLFNSFVTTKQINQSDNNVQQIERSTSNGRVSTRVANIRDNKLIDSITGEHLLPELKQLN